MPSFISKARKSIEYLRHFQKYEIFTKYKDFTMIPVEEYINNLRLAERVKTVNGCVVECGVWRGGMIAGMSEIVGKDRHYYLFDSFEGLPEAHDIDGEAALKWQSDKTSVAYFDNCKAEIGWAEKVMKLANAKNVIIVKGWFNETMPLNTISEPIALLRLDADWYDSTMVCMDYLFEKVATNGIIIIDDYHAWEGCSKAVHDYLSKHQKSERIAQFNNRTVFIVKK
jgi:O-methyltransferase